MVTAVHTLNEECLIEDPNNLFEVLVILVQVAVVVYSHQFGAVPK